MMITGAALMLAIFSSCQQGGKTEGKDTTVTSEQAQVDSVKLLSEEVMNSHDEGMVGTMKMRSLKKNWTARSLPTRNRVKRSMRSPKQGSGWIQPTPPWTAGCTHMTWTWKEKTMQRKSIPARRTGKSESGGRKDQNCHQRCPDRAEKITSTAVPQRLPYAFHISLKLSLWLIKKPFSNTSKGLHV
ncbi:hypothetical protein MKQ70_31265 [Chitinophaga sedimenti]|uniref:hypothetical protein n=1 Tax=Chitinophaga sedimenti TaxID=2033606 RepID=UPI002006510A|nr:hypothetical protein [Chitinophaga sedimenti]MCK7559209.1 hypothetical protein [Chitinophaga sedimenti]